MNEPLRVGPFVNAWQYEKHFYVVVLVFYLLQRHFVHQNVLILVLHSECLQHDLLLEVALIPAMHCFFFVLNIQPFFHPLNFFILLVIGI